MATTGLLIFWNFLMEYLAFTEMPASMDTPPFRSYITASAHMPSTSSLDPPSIQTSSPSLSPSRSMEMSSSSSSAAIFDQILTSTRTAPSVPLHTQLPVVSASAPIPESGYALVFMQITSASVAMQILSASPLTPVQSSMPASFYSHAPLLPSMSLLQSTPLVTTKIHIQSPPYMSAAVNMNIPLAHGTSTSASTQTPSPARASVPVSTQTSPVSASAPVSTQTISPASASAPVSTQTISPVSASAPVSTQTISPASASTPVCTQTISPASTSVPVSSHTISPASTSAPVSTQLPSASGTSSSATLPSTGWLTVEHIEYGLSSQKCTFAKSGQCCRDDGATLSMTVDSATLRQIVRSLRQRGNVNKIWINGTSCFLSQKAKCDILSVFNGTNVYATANANESHFSLCQRPVYSRPACREFYHEWESVGSTEYLKLGKPRTYKKAEAECRKYNADLLNAKRVMTDRFLLDGLQLRHTNGDFWIRNNIGFFSHSTTSSHCVALNIENMQLSQKNFDCYDSLYSICERPVSVTLPISTHSVSQTVTTTITTSRKPDWMKYKRHEYYVTEDRVSYAEAEDFCKRKLNSSLAFFTMATMYLKLAVMLKLDQENYLVGAGLEPTSDGSCLLLQVQGWNSSALYSTDCSNTHRSICRRPVKDDSLPFDPKFLKMLEDMSEVVKTTKTRLRKLTSASDNRKSAEAVGLVGLSFILVVSLIIIGFDVTNLKRCQRRRRRTISSSTA